MRDASMCAELYWHRPCWMPPRLRMHQIVAWKEPRHMYTGNRPSLMHARHQSRTYWHPQTGVLRMVVSRVHSWCPSVTDTAQPSV